MNNNRILSLNTNKSSGESIVYVMSRDQRLNDNHALLRAQETALEKSLPLHIVFVVLDKTGVRTREQYQFMYDGLLQLQKTAKEMNVGFDLLAGKPQDRLIQRFTELKPAHVVFDFNPMRGPRTLQKKIAAKLTCSVEVVDAHNIVPLWMMSDKEEFAAHTIRNKVHKNLSAWLVEPGRLINHPHDAIESIHEDSAIEEIINKQKSTGATLQFVSGEPAALDHLRIFLKERLTDYARDRNVPTLNGQSNMSPYLHFGQLSSLRIALEVMRTMNEVPLLYQRAKLASFEGEHTHADSCNAFLEELIVRKELADNFVFFNDSYDSIDGAKDWAKESLQLHANDDREYIYTLEQWESADIHDEAWNAAQKEMMKTGKMHGYMRMYWAKKILEWSESPGEALRIAIYLNDTYSIDGGDPNGYTGIMWSIAGVHDRPWFERDVFGKIRFMNRGGLERRFDVEEYIAKWT